MRMCLFFFILLPAIFLFIRPAFAQDVGNREASSGEHIGKFESDIRINMNGTIDVLETILYDFGTEFRHGIFRTIPYTKKGKDGKRVDLSFEGITVADKDGKPYVFKKSDSNEQVILQIGDPNSTITGIHTYIISYTVSGAIGYFTDHDELYWNSTGNGWNVPIAAIQTRISLPKSIRFSQIKTACFTGSQDSTEKDCTVLPLQQNAFRFSTNNTLPPYSGLTVLLGFPKNVVAFLPPTVYVPFFERPIGILTLTFMFLSAFFWYLVLPILLVILWFKYGRDPYVGKPVTAWYDPPQTKNRRFLTPAETGGLVDETVDNRDIFATIIDLARRGYIRIEEREKKDFHLIFTSKSKLQDKIQPFEEELLTGIFAGEREVRVKDTQMYATINKVSDMLHKNLVKNGYFKTNPKTIRTWYYILGGFAVFTLNFVLAFVAFLFGKNMPRKTLFGAEQANVGKGLKNFLSSQKRQLKFQGDKQMLFEKLLPYAVAFGVEKIWAQRFAAFDLKPPTWYRGYSGSTFNSVIFASSLHSSYSSFASVSHAPSGTGSGFGGGGFSGGGGGGGGGGSW